MNIDPFILDNLVMIMTAFAAAALAALWLSLIIWTWRDIRKRIRDPLLYILAVLTVIVLFIPGVVIYLILRPAHTQEEEYQRALEEEALLQSIEDGLSCPTCGRMVKEDWLACPYCHTKLKKNCPQCARLNNLNWTLCPYCATIYPDSNQSKEKA